MRRQFHLLVGQRTTRRRRRAAVLIAALVCLGIVMALVGCMLLAAMQTGRHLHVQRDLRQCELLLAAGIARATSQSAANTEYRGEKWELSAEQIIGKAAGEVTIEIVPEPSGGKSQFLIVAEYPLGGAVAIRRSQTIVVPFTRPLRQE